MTTAIRIGLIFAISLAAAAETDPPGNYDRRTAPGVNELLPIGLAQSVHHSVESVEIEGRHYRFHVDSEFGPYMLTSLALLRERVREIEILADVSNRFAADMPAAAEEVRGQYRISADSAVDILTRPVTAAGDIAGQVAENLNETLTGIPASEDNSPAYRYRMEEELEPTAAMHKRNIAFQWGLDPYTGNHAVQKLLIGIAKARSGGRISAGAPPLSRLRPSATAIADKQIEQAISLRLKSEDPETLSHTNAAMLAAMDMPRELVRTFIDHETFSPSRKTRIVQYLEALGDVRSRADLLAAAVNARDETMACAFEQSVMMLVHYDRNVAPLAALHTGRQMLQAITQERHIVFFAPVDFIDWSASTEQLFDELQNRASAAGYDQWEIAVSGTLTARARKEIEQRQFVLRERFVE